MFRSILFLFSNSLITENLIIFYFFFLQELSWYVKWHRHITTAQKLKFSIKDFFSKCNKIRSFLWIWSHLLKKSLMENFIFWALNFLDSIWFLQKRSEFFLGILSNKQEFLWKAFAIAIFNSINIQLNYYFKIVLSPYWAHVIRR